MQIFVRKIGRIWKMLTPGMRTWIMRRLQQKFTASVVGIITNEQGELLLLNHVLRPRSGWGMPGGFMSRSEQPATALRREIREETGLELDDLALYRVRTLKRHIEIIFTATAADAGEIRSREITELRWFDPDGLPPEMSIDQQFLIKAVLRPDEQNN